LLFKINEGKRHIHQFQTKFVFIINILTRVAQWVR